jgi:hypothetical protein
MRLLMGGCFAAWLLCVPQAAGIDLLDETEWLRVPALENGSGNAFEKSATETPGADFSIASPTVEDAAITEVAAVKLDQNDAARLANAGWADRVGEGRGVWVDASAQRLLIIENGRVCWQAPCSTAEAGIGNVEGSLQTPPGWHRVSGRFGEGQPWGRIFRSRAATGKCWSPGDKTDEDLVLTRVLWLEGLEPGVNLGKNESGQVVDSKQRCIYIHGTNDEDRIGQPASHGCVRLTNDDVLVAFAEIPDGTPVLITP